MKKWFSEAQIIGFLREADSGVSVTELCRRHGFSEASCYLGGRRIFCHTEDKVSRRSTTIALHHYPPEKREAPEQSSTYLAGITVQREASWGGLLPRE